MIEPDDVSKAWCPDGITEVDHSDTQMYSMQLMYSFEGIYLFIDLLIYFRDSECYITVTMKELAWSLTIPSVAPGQMLKCLKLRNSLN